MRIRRTRCTRAPVTTLMGNEGSGQALFRITGLGQGRAAREKDTVQAATRDAMNHNAKVMSPKLLGECSESPPGQRSEAGSKKQRDP